MNEPTIACDRVGTAAYQAAVESYLADQVLGSGRQCICPDLEHCSKSAAPNHFAAAQLSLLADTFDGDGGVTFDGDEVRSP